jgi:hypothetical protein
VRHSLSLVLFACLGCAQILGFESDYVDDPGAAGSGGSGGSIDGALAAYCQTYSEVCENKAPDCCAASGLPFSQEACASRAKQECDSLAADVKSGKLEFDPSQISACATARSDLQGCGYDLSHSVAARFMLRFCDYVFLGKAAPGDPCETSQDCMDQGENTLVECSDTASGKRCRTYVRALEGQPCDIAFDGLTSIRVCVSSSKSSLSTCRATTSDAGSEGICVPQQSPNKPCFGVATFPSECESGYCAPGNVCEGYLAAGTSCEPSTGGPECEGGCSSAGACLAATNLFVGYCGSN